MPQGQQERAHGANGTTNNTTYTSGMDRRQGRSSRGDDDSPSACRKVCRLGVQERGVDRCDWHHRRPLFACHDRAADQNARLDGKHEFIIFMRVLSQLTLSLDLMHR